eukprot:TRINITY_DN583_c0_g1_i7.p1 TRINITY_DN583_c0_g1~~TRINITY_DN583_c0_g1_i7.p1  ORF type:complete len:299 (-),score=44.83 TRINITY_DN583_c0_g1_i7:899-1795(-)
MKRSREDELIGDADAEPQAKSSRMAVSLRRLPAQMLGAGEGGKNFVQTINAEGSVPPQIRRVQTTSLRALGFSSQTAAPSAGPGVFSLSGDPLPIELPVRQARTGTPARAVMRLMSGLADVAAVFHLGEELFDSSSLPNLFRMWDTYCVMSAISDPHLCRVIELPSGVPGRAGEIIGFLLGSIIQKRTVRVGYVDWVGVKAGYRRQGLGTALYQQFIQSVHERGVNVLVADTQANNNIAVAFLNKMGLRDAVPHLYLSFNLQHYVPEPVSHIARDGSISMRFTCRAQALCYTMIFSKC